MSSNCLNTLGNEGHQMINLHSLDPLPGNI